MQLLGRDKYADKRADTEDFYSHDTILYGTMVNTSFITICIPITPELLDDVLV